MAEESVIALNSLRLAQSFAKILKDMRGFEYRLDEAHGRVRKAGQPGGGFPMRVGIRYSGFLNGEYVAFLGIETAARLAGLWTAGEGLPALEAAREEGESLIKEVLNSAVGSAIRELERMAGGLDFEPATVDYRDTDAALPPAPFPANPGKHPSPSTSGLGDPWGELLILGDAGPVLCCFFMDPRGAGDAA